MNVIIGKNGQIVFTGSDVFIGDKVQLVHRERKRPMYECPKCSGLHAIGESCRYKWELSR